MTKFIATETESDIWKVRKYKIHGFWSGDSVRVTRSISYIDFKTWEKPEVNWSCGGRDTAEEPDDLVAAECFAAALMDAIENARKWRDEA